MSSEIAIEVKGLSKCYQIYDQPGDRLKQFVLPRLQQLVAQPPIKYYREFWALRDVAFDVRKGETVGIVGRNGSGKSTLLQMIAGTLTPTSGIVKTHGRIAALLELGSGFNPEFTGRENVYLNGVLLGFTTQQISERFDEIAAFADIGEHIDQPVKTYSSGMFVRLAFSVVANLEPTIFIVDEALSVGDFIFQQKCANYMKNTLSGVTKILVSHDLAAISSMADRVLVLDEGKIAFFGDTQTGLAVYQKVARASIEGRKLDANSVGNSQQEGEERETEHDWLAIEHNQLSGTGRGLILKAYWTINGMPFARTIKKEELLSLVFIFEVMDALDSPIFGYQVQDRFGTVIFGGNTHDISFEALPISPGIYRVAISVVWPQVAPGEYGVTLGVGNGSDSTAHVVECWAHNIIILGSVQVDPVHGIFNNKIDGCDVRKINQ